MKKIKFNLTHHTFSSLHHESNSGFALTELVVCITVFCIISILALQLYISNYEKQIISVSANSIEQKNSDDNTIIDDSDVPLGASQLFDGNYLSISFGTSPNSVSIIVPGKIVTLNATDNQSMKSYGIMSFRPY